LTSRTNFPLFSSHIDLAHKCWAGLVQDGDTVIDATCGNGHDTLMLAKLNSARVYAIDIQDKAIQASKEYIKMHLSDMEQSKIQWICASHAAFPAHIPEGSVRLIVYNLGYLPGGDKSLVTRFDTTLQSLENALRLIMPGGCISLTCYPGHPEGAVEEVAVLDFAARLNPAEWSCCHHRWLNRRQSPSLLIIQNATFS
jgi:tRNA G37 N-methylase Trm5